MLYLSKDDSSNIKDIGPEHFIVTNFYRGKYTLTEDGRALTPDGNITQDELLSTINQTENNASSTVISNGPGISNNTEIPDSSEMASKREEGNSNSTPESKNAPFISYFWVLTALLGAVSILRRM